MLPVSFFAPLNSQWITIKHKSWEAAVIKLVTSSQKTCEGDGVVLGVVDVTPGILIEDGSAIVKDLGQVGPAKGELPL